MNGTCVIFGILFLAAGILFALGFLHVHMAAWKAMTEEERNAARIKPICRNVGAMIALCGIIFLVSGLSKTFMDRAFSWSMTGWILLSCLDLYHINKKYGTKGGNSPWQ